MDNKEFLDFIIDERISNIYSKLKQKGTDQIETETQQIIDNLPQKDREQLEIFLNEFIDQSANTERYLYRQGFKDGFKAFRELIKA